MISTVQGKTRKTGRPRKKSSEGWSNKVMEVTAITVTETAPETETLEGTTEADKMTESLSMVDG